MHKQESKLFALGTQIFDHVQNFCTDLLKLHTREEHCLNGLSLSLSLPEWPGMNMNHVEWSICARSAVDSAQWDLSITSTNNFHSCLRTLKTCSYHLCRTACTLYSSHSCCIPGCSNFILCHSYMTVRLGHDQKTVRNKTNGAQMCQRLLQSRYSC